MFELLGPLCHLIFAHSSGPSLSGICGRQAGAASGFACSAAMQS